MVKRRLAVGLVLALGILAAGVSATGSYGAKKAPITLTMWSYDNQDPGLEPVLKQLSKQFEAKHAGVKINLVFKDFNSLVGTVPRALASGSGPDVTEGNQGYQTDAQLVKFVGNVPAKPPTGGILRHKGWRAAKVDLPQLSSKQDAAILAPAEIEIE